MRSATRDIPGDHLLLADDPDRPIMGVGDGGIEDVPRGQREAEDCGEEEREIEGGEGEHGGLDRGRRRTVKKTWTGVLDLSSGHHVTVWHNDKWQGRDSLGRQSFYAHACRQ
jgi:hypothetical protein